MLGTLTQVEQDIKKKGDKQKITGEIVSTILSKKDAITSGSLSAMTGLNRPEVELIIQVDAEGLSARNPKK